MDGWMDEYLGKFKFYKLIKWMVLTTHGTVCTYVYAWKRTEECRQEQR